MKHIAALDLTILLWRRDFHRLVLVTQSCLILYNPMDFSPPGSSVHGISQARILKWVAISFYRESFPPKDQTWSPALRADSLPSEPTGKPRIFTYDTIKDIWESKYQRSKLWPTKVHLVKAMVFPVVMYGCESWTVKKAERRKIDVFELWCWRRLLRVPWTARRSNQSILKEIGPECSLEGLMLKLKLHYFGHLMRRVDWKRP